jgi:hypothetical protein
LRIAYSFNDRKYIHYYVLVIEVGLFLGIFDDTDRDKDYKPDLDKHYRSSSCNENMESSYQHKANSDVRGRKRVQKESNWKKNRAKHLRNHRQEYIGHKGQRKYAKSVKTYEHNCRYKCNGNFTEEYQNEIFSDFWNLGSWDLQTSFLNKCIIIYPPERQSKTAIQSRKNSCRVLLKGKSVCKNFFLMTLDISVKHFDNIAKNKTVSGVSPKHKRCKHEPANKISQSLFQFVKAHIQSFPKYTSHYSWDQNPYRKYLCSSLNIHKMHDLYKELCTQKGKTPVKESYYRHVFNTSFNFSFHKPHTDTCTTCDRLKNIIQAHEDQDKVTEALMAKEITFNEPKLHEWPKIKPKSKQRSCLTPLKLSVLTCRKLCPLLC